jgi:hypothetical protein
MLMEPSVSSYLKAPQRLVKDGFDSSPVPPLSGYSSDQDSTFLATPPSAQPPRMQAQTEINTDEEEDSAIFDEFDLEGFTQDEIKAYNAMAEPGQCLRDTLGKEEADDVPRVMQRLCTTNGNLMASLPAKNIPISFTAFKKHDISAVTKSTAPPTLKINERKAARKDAKRKRRLEARRKRRLQTGTNAPVFEGVFGRKTREFGVDPEQSVQNNEGKSDVEPVIDVANPPSKKRRKPFKNCQGRDYQAEKARPPASGKKTEQQTHFQIPMI